MSAIDTLENRCRICGSLFTDLTCSISIFGDTSANFFLQRKIEKYLYITVSISLKYFVYAQQLVVKITLKRETIDSNDFWCFKK